MSPDGVAVRQEERKPALRRLMIAASGVLTTLALALGGEPATAAARSDEVIAAVRAKDAVKLRDLAASEDPDPWLVADELCRRGEGETATVFALALRASPDVEALPRFVAQTASSKPAPSITAALRRAESAKDRKALIEAVRSAGDVASPFDRARLANELGLGLRRVAAAAQAADAAVALAEAADAFIAAADEAAQVGWLRMEGDTLHDAGLMFAKLVEYGRARTLWTRRLDVEHRRKRRDRAANCLRNLATLDGQVGDYPAACAKLEEAVAEMEKFGESSRRDAISALQNLALARQRAGQYAMAVAACRRAIELLAAKGEERLRARSLLIEGDIRLDLADAEGAAAAHRDALAAAQESGDAAMVGLCRAALGNDQRVRGDFGEALATFETALRSLTQPDQQPIVLRLLVNLTVVHTGRRDFAAARECGGRAVALAERLGLDPLRAHALQNLSEACRGDGDLPAARARRPAPPSRSRSASTRRRSPPTAGARSRRTPWRRTTRRARWRRRGRRSRPCWR